MQSHSTVHCPETVENAQVGHGVGLGVGLLTVGCGVGDGMTPSRQDCARPFCTVVHALLLLSQHHVVFSDEALLLLKRDIIVVLRYCDILASLIR